MSLYGVKEEKKIYGDEYDDRNLVFCHPTEKPMEGQVVNRALQKLIADHNFPKFVFHSFRHARMSLLKQRNWLLNFLTIRRLYHY